MRDFLWSSFTPQLSALWWHSQCARSLLTSPVGGETIVLQCVSFNLDFKGKAYGTFICHCSCSIARKTHHSTWSPCPGTVCTFYFCKYQHQMADPQITTPHFNPVSLCWLIIQNLLREYHCGMTEKGLGMSGFPPTGRGHKSLLWSSCGSPTAIVRNKQILNNLHHFQLTFQMPKCKRSTQSGWC